MICNKSVRTKTKSMCKCPAGGEHEEIHGINSALIQVCELNRNIVEHSSPTHKYLVSFVSERSFSSHFFHLCYAKFYMYQSLLLREFEPLPLRMKKKKKSQRSNHSISCVCCGFFFFFSLQKY